MREIRIYQPGVYEPTQTFALSEEASHHVGVVLRMESGERLTLFCGDNREFSATIIDVRKKGVTVTIDAVREANKESKQALHLVQGISKGDRMEWVIQKATELGVTSITPVITHHCSVKLDHDRLKKKQAQWQAIAIAACEQSGRNQIPDIHPTLRLDVFLQQCQTSSNLILHPQGNQSWRNVRLGDQAITLMVGPEGGFGDEEVQQAIAKTFQPICLGPRVLRTETAAIAALSVLQAMHGDL